MALSEFVSVSECARAFGVAPKTIREWLKRGRLTAVTTPGGRNRFLRVAVVEALMRHAHPVPRWLTDDVEGAGQRAAGG
ncbi:MAG TPA: helix-turn-helix domain-containing protein [Polyangia bacterium]|jgi:excisionase family DNA binding protein